MRVKVRSVVLAEQAVVVAVTKSKGRPRFATIFLLGLSACVMILSFQNCAVDLSATTPGASTSGACASPTAQALTDIQTVISGVIQTNCSSCHGRTTGTVGSSFAAPDASENAASPAVQSYTYMQLCLRGGKAVGLKIDGTTSHGGGSFSRSGPQAPLFNYLNTYF